MTTSSGNNNLVFSIHTDEHIKRANGIFGYSYGYDRIKKHFGEFSYKGRGMSVLENSPKSPIQMFYMEPEWYNQTTMTDLRAPGFRKFHDNQYKIYGTHLEATKVWSHWIKPMNAVDEIWVGNYFAKDAVLNSGIHTPTYVFEHGIDDMWKPKKRNPKGPIRFLHVDSDSPRKRADLVEKAFIHLFKNRNDVSITFKHHGDSNGNVISVNSLLRLSDEGNIYRIYETLSQQEMVQLFYEHDILIYPSEGEGFGFIPLQALATGMPTISTSRWCSYEKYLGSNVIESKLGKTSHTGYDHGEVVLADYESIIYLMQNAVDNFDAQSDYFYNQAKSVYKEYNWKTRCDSMLNDAINRLGVDLFEIDNDVEDEIVYLIYCGDGSYNTIDGIRFTRESRVHPVDRKSATGLLSTGLFSQQP